MKPVFSSPPFFLRPPGMGRFLSPSVQRRKAPALPSACKCRSGCSLPRFTSMVSRLPVGNLSEKDKWISCTGVWDAFTRAAVVFPVEDCFFPCRHSIRDDIFVEQEETFFEVVSLLPFYPANGKHSMYGYEWIRLIQHRMIGKPFGELSEQLFQLLKQSHPRRAQAFHQSGLF